MNQSQISGSSNHCMVKIGNNHKSSRICKPVHNCSVSTFKTPNMGSQNFRPPTTTSMTFKYIKEKKYVIHIQSLKVHREEDQAAQNSGLFAAAEKEFYSTPS